MKLVFWVGIVCWSLGLATRFLYDNTLEFMNATVVTTVETMTAPLSQVLGSNTYPVFVKYCIFTYT